MTEPDRSLPELARAEECDALEERWLESCEALPDDAAPFIEAAKILRDNGDKAQVAVLLSLLLPHYESGGDPGDRAALLEIAADCDPDDLSCRRQLVEALELSHPDSKGIRAFIRAADIEGSPKPSEAVAKMREFMVSFEVGRFVYHATSWGAGKIVRISPSTGNMTVDFERNLGHSMPISGAATLLEPLDDNDFRAMRFAQLDELKRLASEDPAALFESLLKVRRGRATTKQVKLDLQDTVIPSKEWSRWWPSAKRALRDAPLIDMTAGTNPEFTLRDEPQSPEESLAERYRATKQFSRKVAIARECVERFASFESAEDLASEIASDLWTRAKEIADAEPAHALELFMLAEKLGQCAGQAGTPEGTTARELIETSDHPAALLQAMTFDDLRREALGVARGLWPEDWPDIWGEMLQAPSPSAADYVVRELEGTGNTDALRVALDDVVQNASDCPESMIWLWKRASADKLPVPFDAMAKAALFERLLKLTNEVAGIRDEGGDASILSKLRSTLSANNFDMVEAVAESIPRDEVTRLHDIVSFTRGLSEAGKATILHILEAAVPEQFEKQLERWEEDCVYTAKAGLDTQREELVRLTTVEYRKITVAIGEAAAMGDISDNAEYQSALEARQRLTERASVLKAQVDSSKLITPDIVPNDHIGVGSTAELKDLSDGSMKTFAFLGPWDANPDQDIYSYLAPFAQTFLGKKPGEVVEVTGGGTTARYEVIALGSAL